MGMGDVSSSEPSIGDIVGTIRRRLLVNAWADPDEVESHLPTGLRPHVGSTGGVIVGCCMIEIADIRPWPLPAAAGVDVRAAAHRISVDVGPESAPRTAVYVPGRNTDSKLTIAAGGRVFPGVHKSARVSVKDETDELSWSISNYSNGGSAFDITTTADLSNAAPASSEVAEIVIGTTLGLSPGHRTTTLEAVQMVTATSDAEIVVLADLESSFIGGFASAEETDTLLMTDVGVIWRRESVEIPEL